MKPHGVPSIPPRSTVTFPAAAVPARTASGDTRRIALVGAGSFATNAEAVLSMHGFEVALVVDEFRTGSFLGAPLRRAAELGPADLEGVEKFLVAISMPAHNQAAVERLVAAGIERARILPLGHDSALQMLGLLLRRYGPAAVEAILSDTAQGMPELERELEGRRWDEVLAARDPARRTLAICCYGKGGGFRNHIRAVGERLAQDYETIVLTDDDVDLDDVPHPVLFQSTETAEANTHMDVALTANCHPCSPRGVPRVSFMHMIYDFILDVPMLVDFAAQADPHYIVCPSRPSLDWFARKAVEEGLRNRLVLVPGGYARLDENIRTFEAYAGPVDSLIYAPTPFMLARENSHLTYSMPYAGEFLRVLAQAFPEFRIIFRPHPFDMTCLRTNRSDERVAVLRGVADVAAGLANVVLDENKLSYMESYSRSAVMISDTSSTAFTYAFSTGRPVVFYSPHDDAVRSSLGHFAYIRDRENLGLIAGTPDELVARVRGLLDDQSGWGERIRTFRAASVYQVGRSVDYISEHFHHVLSGERHPDWTYFNF